MSTSKDVAARIALLACLAIAIISRLAFLSDPFRNDAGIYIYMGKTLVDGGQLYRDFFETKLPSVALLTAPLYAIFGSSWACYVVFQLALSLSAAVGLAAAARRYIADAAHLPVLLGAVVLLNCSRFVLTGFQLETLQCAAAMAAAGATLAAPTANG